MALFLLSSFQPLIVPHPPGCVSRSLGSPEESPESRAQGRRAHCGEKLQGRLS